MRTDFFMYLLYYELHPDPGWRFVDSKSALITPHKHPDHHHDPHPR